MSYTQSKRIYYIDSHDRVSGTHSDFTYFLDMKNEDYDSVVLLQASIPKSYYIVQNGRNTFTLDENGTQVVISLPIGNYSRSSFRAQLQTSLNASSPNGWAYVVSVPNASVTADNGFYTFTVSGNGGIQPQFIPRMQTQLIHLLEIA